MNFYQRRTIHHYKKQKVEDHLIKEALSTALYAPNHKRTYPWGFVWLGEKTRQKLAELAVSLKSGLTYEAEKRLFEKFSNTF